MSSIAAPSFFKCSTSILLLYARESETEPQISVRVAEEFPALEIVELPRGFPTLRKPRGD